VNDKVVALPDRWSGWLLIVFAFTAWNWTGFANFALLLLTLRCIREWRANQWSLPSIPGLWLLLLVFSVTTVLALRTSWQFPATTGAQLAAIWRWDAPFLFIIIAWRLRVFPQLIPQLLLAALLGLTLGVLRKFDVAQFSAIVHGQRYDSGTAVLGLSFLASIALLGLFWYREQLLALTRWRRINQLIWGLLTLIFIAFLLIAQARGATLGLVIVGLSLMLTKMRSHSIAAWRRPILLLVLLTTSLLWLSRERITNDWNALELTIASIPVSYETSLGARLNLYRVGFIAFTAHPLIGWGPGSSTTKMLVPMHLLPLPIADMEQAPAFAHLHSIPLELLVRFGAIGVIIALLLSLLLLRAWLHLHASDSQLSTFLIACIILTCWFGVYDFRLLNLDLRFFLILFLGIIYSFHSRQRDEHCHFN
jgi:O-antigen ligase